MANVTKQKRDEMIKFLEELKNTHTDDSSIRAFNEIENALTEKKFGLVFEEHTEYVDDLYFVLMKHEKYAKIKNCLITLLLKEITYKLYIY